MINLQEYKRYWQGVAKRLPEIREVMAVTVDEQMGKKILNLKPEQTPTLFFLPPTGEGTGSNADNFIENNLCVIFVMQRYDPQRSDTFDVLERTQPIIERVKALMLDDQAAGCPVMRFDVSSLNTLPETEFYRNFAGWSIGFTAKSF